MVGQPRQAAADDDLLTFLDEDADPAHSLLDAQEPWILLVVDDEPQVHEATALTLHRSRIAQRPFFFLHAFSAAEAREIIRDEPRIDLVLLDVMMETRDAGLRLVTDLRGPLGHPDLKILIRSGQPGFEHDATVRERYPVDGYLPKATQTYSLLMEVISDLLLGTSAPRSTC